MAAAKGAAAAWATGAATTAGAASVVGGALSGAARADERTERGGSAATAEEAV
jgi:hypothetical protein